MIKNCLERKLCKFTTIWLEGSKAEENNIDGLYDIVYENDKPMMRRGFQVWKHETENVYLSVSSDLNWQFIRGEEFIKDSTRTRDINFFEPQILQTS